MHSVCGTRIYKPVEVSRSRLRPAYISTFSAQLRTMQHYLTSCPNFRPIVTKALVLSLPCPEPYMFHVAKPHEAELLSKYDSCDSGRMRVGRAFTPSSPIVDSRASSMLIGRVPSLSDSAVTFVSSSRLDHHGGNAAYEETLQTTEDGDAPLKYRMHSCGDELQCCPFFACSTQNCMSVLISCRSKDS